MRLARDQNNHEVRRVIASSLHEMFKIFTPEESMSLGFNDLLTTYLQDNQRIIIEAVMPNIDFSVSTLLSGCQNGTSQQLEQNLTKSLIKAEEILRGNWRVHKVFFEKY